MALRSVQCVSRIAVLLGRLRRGDYGGPLDSRLLKPRTHIRTANLFAAFAEAVLHVLLFIALVVPDAPDEIVQRLFEPVGCLSISMR